MDEKQPITLNGGMKDKNGVPYPWYWDEDHCEKYPDLESFVYCPFFGGIEFSLGFKKKPNQMFSHKIKLTDLLGQASAEGWKIVSHVGYNNRLD